MMSLIGLHKFADIIFGITQKPLYIISRLFDNPLSKYLIFNRISRMQCQFWVIYQN